MLYRTPLRKLRQLIVPTGALAFVICLAFARTAVQQEVLGKGKEYATAYYTFEGKKKGPTLFVQGGIHGSEPAGTYAIEQLIQELCVSSGRVVLLPRLHRLALATGKRFLQEDLNRSFPGDLNSSVLERRLAAENFGLVRKMNPDLILTLHESRELEDSQSLITGKKPIPSSLRNLVALVNERVTLSDRHFRAKFYPVEHSSSEEYTARLKCEAYAVETWLADPIEARVHLHKAVIQAAMEHLGIVYSLSETSQGSGH